MTKKSQSPRRPRIKKEHDPHFEREAAKYADPIPSREYILKLLHDLSSAPTRKELEERLQLTTPERIEALRRRLRAMERDGQLLRSRNGQYRLVEKMDLVRGRVQGHKDGFGFIIPDEGGEEYFLTPREMQQVFHGDRVLACKDGHDPRGRPMGRIVEVLQRNTEQLVGRYYQEGGVSFVRPDNVRIHHTILMQPGDEGGAKRGQFVTVQITVQPGMRQQPMGKVLEVLGDHMAPGMEIDVAIRSHAIPWQWPPEVLAEVASWERAKQLPASALQARRDCRDLPFVTIDGEDARDFDDAIFVQARKQGGWRLFVAIADVSYYVKPGSALDQEAQSRGTSVYFPSEVIPMLPEILSNGWCSLQAEVDRLAMVCEMQIDGAGKLLRYEFFEAVIRSHARLTYTEVAQMLQGGNVRGQVRYRTLLPHLQEAYRLYQILLKSRTVRGAIDFDTIETRIIFGADRKIQKIIPRERNDAHRLIEECMLMANVAAARLLKKRKEPGIYRIHEAPMRDKVSDLQTFLHECGISFKTDGKTPADFTQLLKRCQKRSDYHLLQTMVLRTMSQAVYSTDNVGHFGLAYPAYTHFTSPIRRYPDLMVHRMIRQTLLEDSKETLRYTPAELQNIAERSSAAERRADDATRDVEKWLKCEYMLDKIGNEFDGVISGVTGFGLFVELKMIFVDGLVHISSLANDYFRFDAMKHRLQGERTGLIYQLGDAVRVRVMRVDLDERTIDFELASKTTTDNKGKKPAKAKQYKKKSR